MEYNEITIFKQSIEACADPAEIARKVKLAFKKMPVEEALTCFAKVMTLGDADSYRPDLRDVKKKGTGQQGPVADISDYPFLRFLCCHYDSGANFRCR